MFKRFRDEITSNVNYTIDIMKDIKTGAKNEVISLFVEAKSI